MPALNNDVVPYFGFPVAFVVADTFEQATAAAAMVHVHYEPQRGVYDLHAAGPTAINPDSNSSEPAASSIGEFGSLLSFTASIQFFTCSGVSFSTLNVNLGFRLGVGASMVS